MPTCLCEHCTAVCCRYIALPIDKPATRDDFENIRWYLAHQDVTVFIDKGEWYISFATRCRYLQDDHRCGIYKKRPKICRSYRAVNCDYEGGEYRYEAFFSEPAQIEAYAAERLARKRKNTRKPPRAAKTAPKGNGKTRKRTRKATKE